MAEDSENPYMRLLSKEDIGYRVISDCRALYMSKLASLIKNCEESTYGLQTQDWEILTKDADTNCIGTIFMKYEGNRGRVYFDYNKDFKDMFLQTWEAKCDNTGLPLMALKQGTIPTGGHFIDNELFRITIELKFEKLGSLVRQGVGEFDLEVSLVMQYLAMSRKPIFGWHT